MNYQTGKGAQYLTNTAVNSTSIRLWVQSNRVLRFRLQLNCLFVIRRMSKLSLGQVIASLLYITLTWNCKLLQIYHESWYIDSMNDQERKRIYLSSKMRYNWKLSTGFRRIRLPSSRYIQFDPFNLTKYKVWMSAGQLSCPPPPPKRMNFQCSLIHKQFNSHRSYLSSYKLLVDQPVGYQVNQHVNSERRIWMRSTIIWDLIWDQFFEID